MLQISFDVYLSFFRNPNPWGIGLALLFGAIWIVCFWPFLFRTRRFWISLILVLIVSAIFTHAVLAFIQFPVQNIIGRAMLQLWGSETLTRLVIISILPTALIGGLIQEGAKLVPVVLYWWRNGKNIDPKLGLVIGAVAGAGFGIFEAQWAYNSVLAAGWSWDAVHINGIMGLIPFIERFFIIAFQVAACALAGYGLAKGQGWQFYLLASLLHTVVNYVNIIAPSQIFSLAQLETFIAFWAILITGAALWIRWKKIAARK